ncbi:MAG TPA: ABC transporter permease [Polyangia bacterium]|nr:ABC transporter permease [Polyangia bacterium]
MTTQAEAPPKHPIVRLADFVVGLPMGFVRGVGQHARLLFQAAAWAVRPPYRVRLLIEQAEFIGVESVPIIALTGFFSGAVIALQGVYAFRLVQAERFVGTALGLTLTRELGPVFTCLMITARAASGMATELGSMRITEQIDAITAFAVNPVQYLVTPRLLAGTIMAPLLTMVFNLTGIFGGYMAAVVIENVDPAQFFYTLRWYTDPTDVFQGLFKAMVFGLTLTLVGCFQGFFASGGAKGVGIATTRAVVISSVLILCLDYFLGDILLAVLSK